MGRSIVRIAIHGLGRIGRLALRQLIVEPGIEIAAVDDSADARTLAHLLKHDSVHRESSFSVAWTDESLILGGKAIPLLRSRTAFGDTGAELVLECSEPPIARDGIAALLEGTVRHVLLPEPSEAADLTVLMGVNQDRLDPDIHRVISAGGGTATCLGILTKVLDETFGVDFGLFTDVHSYTNDQRILDLPHRNLRLARAASMSMIPCPSDAAETLGQVMPRLEGRMDGLAVRVPTPDVSLVDLSVLLRQDTDPGAINEAFRKSAADGPMKGSLQVLEEELVSVDLTGRTAGCLLDPFLTKAMTPRYVKVFGWYDNEYGCAARLKDLALELLGRSSGRSLS